MSAKSGTTDSLDVRWTAPANTGRPAIDDYNLQYRIGTTGNFTSHSFSGTGRSTTIAGLNADTSYQVQVQAHNPEGDQRMVGLRDRPHQCLHIHRIQRRNAERPQPERGDPRPALRRPGPPGTGPAWATAWRQPR